MKKIILTVLFLFTSITFSQNESEIPPPPLPLTCEEMIEKANNEISKGIYTRNLFGYIINENREFEKFYTIYLYSKYNIITKNLGCSIEKPVECYLKTMNSKINIQFSPNFFEKEYKRLKNEYSIIVKKYEILDLDKIYFEDLLESKPKFIGNDYDILNYLKKNFNSKVNSPRLTIDKNGNIIDIKFNQYEQEYINKNTSIILKEINNLGKWIPGYIYNKKVISEIDFYLTY